MSLKDLRKNGKNILMITIEKNFLEAFKKLILMGFNIEEENSNKETAVFYLASP